MLVEAVSGVLWLRITVLPKLKAPQCRTYPSSYNAAEKCRGVPSPLYTFGPLPPMKRRLGRPICCVGVLNTPAFSKPRLYPYVPPGVLTLPLFPHTQSVPVVSTAYPCWEPAWIKQMLLRAAMFVGDAIWLPPILPRPRRPLAFLPQTQTVPLVRTAKEKYSPAAMPMTPLRLVTMTGECRSIVVPSPTSPY